jgi:dipeptidase
MNLDILNGWLLAAATAAGAVIWWLFRAVHAKADANERALADFKLHCSETYVTHGNFEKALQGLTETFKAVFAKLDRIEDKLDNKADK